MRNKGLWAADLPDLPGSGGAKPLTQNRPVGSAVVAAGLGRRRVVVGEPDPRPPVDGKEIRETVNTLYQWQWRTRDGDFKAFDKEQCISFETSWRNREDVARVWGTDFGVGQNQMSKFFIDMDEMSGCISGVAWSTVVRRWTPDV